MKRISLSKNLKSAAIALSAVSLTAGGAIAQAFEDPVIGEAGYYVGSYGDGAYWITEGGTNSMFVVYEDGVVVVDAPPSYAQKLPEAIASVTDKPVTHFIYSHYHKDHNGGAGVFGDDVTYIGHALTAEELTRVADPNRPVPSVTFEDAYTLSVGSQTIELSYNGLNHTPGNIITYLPDQKILMLVDIIYPAVVPFADLGIAAHVPGYYDVIETALNYDFEVFQGGHLARPGTREEFLETRDYVLELQESAKTALGVTQPPLQFFDPNSPVENPYHQFSTYFDAAADVCAEIVTQNWGSRLLGTSSFTHSHCWTAILEHNVD